MVMDGPAGKAKLGKAADATRSRILLVAQQVFSLRGYGDVGLREIAATAQCDAALIRRYFGSKEALFEEALQLALDVTELISGPRDDFGVRAVKFFVEEIRPKATPLSMLIFATADPTSRAVALRLLEKEVVAPIASWLGGKDAAERAARISMLCSGYFLYSHILPISSSGGIVNNGTVKWLSEELQRVADDAEKGPAR